MKYDIPIDQKIIDKIEEVKNNLGGWMTIQFTGTYGSEEMLICGGSFNLDDVVCNDAKFDYSDSRRHYLNTWSYFYPFNFQHIEESDVVRVLGDQLIEHIYYLLLPGETSHTTNRGFEICIYEITKVWDIHTFFKYLKKKLRRIIRR